MTEYIIYKLVCNDLNIKYSYVGSTGNFRIRKFQHKSNCGNEKKNHLKIYTTINQNGGWNNWSMIKIETVVCETKLDVRKRERFYYEELNADMNTIYPQRDQKEYNDLNREKIKEYNDLNREQRKEWYEINKEALKEQQKEYYQANKVELKAKRDAKKDQIKTI